MSKKVFNRDDIEAGYLLVVKDQDTGRTFNMTVLPGNYGVNGAVKKADLGCCNPGLNGDWWPLSCFDRDDLTFGVNQVVAVYGVTYNSLLLANSTADRTLLWERKSGPKKMTVAEICKELGYDVEIVE